MSFHSRRDFLKLAGVTAAVSSIPFSPASFAADATFTSAPSVPFDLGIASYTFRAFSLEQAIAMAQRVGVRKLTLKDMHLPLKNSDAELSAAVGKMREAGIELSGCGVIYMTTEDEVHRAFAYAKAVNLTMMIGVPDPSLLALAERKVKETDIALAIHNHGPTDQRYPSPESAYRLIAKMDKRVGLCIDVGHTRRLGLDPAAEVERCVDRLLDVHIKDVSSADATGTTVEIGRGVIDMPTLLATLLRLRYSRTLHFEHEKDQKDPLPGVAESIGYVRGCLAALEHRM